jgi:hypothetical protein
VFVKRERNAAAHACADYVNKLGSGTLLNNMFPEHINKALNHDCNHDHVVMNEEIPYPSKSQKDGMRQSLLCGWDDPDLGDPFFLVSRM